VIEAGLADRLPLATYPVAFTCLAGGLARLAGFEPATRCLDGTVGGSPEAARCGSMGGLAVLIVAGSGAAPPSACAWWLPDWLSEASIVSPMFE
jgi:hypothetical protein